MDSYFQFVREMDGETFSEIKRMAGEAASIFHIADLEDGRAIAAQILTIVDGILETGQFPEQYEDLADVAVGLGSLFGNALCIGYGWAWKDFGNSEEHVVHGVVSPRGFYTNAPMEYMYNILSGNNKGLDGENDNTVLLLYNMLENIDDRPGDKMLVPLA